MNNKEANNADKLQNLQVQEQNQDREQKHRTAGFWVRFYAYIIDVIAISTIGAVVLGLAHQIIPVPANIAGWLTMSIATIGLIGFVYFSVMTRLWSQTLGKMIVGIQVIRRNGNDLDWLTVIIREVPGRTISQLFGVHLGYIWVAFHPQKLGWHDMFCDTYVVHVNDFEKRRWVSTQ